MVVNVTATLNCRDLGSQRSDFRVLSTYGGTFEGVLLLILNAEFSSRFNNGRICKTG